MTTFVHVDQPASHPGVRRAEALMDYVRESRQSNDGTRGLAAVLLAAVLAALLAVADKFVSEWTDGSLLAAWMVLWAVAFFALAMFSGAARSLAARALAGWKALDRRMAAARADAQFLATAQSDPRVMNDLRAAMTRQQSQDELVVHVAPTRSVAVDAAARRSQEVRMPTVYEAMRRMNSARYY